VMAGIKREIGGWPPLTSAKDLLFSTSLLFNLDQWSMPSLWCVSWELLLSLIVLM
jgi:hypothetical protein